MYKIAVIGDRDSIYGFATLGLETFPVLNAREGARELERLAADDYAIIYITEQLQSQIMDTVSRYNDMKLPAIIPIPGITGNTRQGLANISRLVEKAVGSDIV
jgi:V/A-type H+/Na+-transporting ATPase subunit F